MRKFHLITLSIIIGAFTLPAFTIREKFGLTDSDRKRLEDWKESFYSDSAISTPYFITYLDVNPYNEFADLIILKANKTFEQIYSSRFKFADQFTLFGEWTFINDTIMLYPKFQYGNSLSADEIDFYKINKEERDMFTIPHRYVVEEDWSLREITDFSVFIDDFVSDYPEWDEEKIVKLRNSLKKEFPDLATIPKSEKSNILRPLGQTRYKENPIYLLYGMEKYKKSAVK